MLKNFFGLSLENIYEENINHKIMYNNNNEKKNKKNWNESFE